jgi:hypothetical protein
MEMTQIYAGMARTKKNGVIQNAITFLLNIVSTSLHFLYYDAIMNISSAAIRKWSRAIKPRSAIGNR